MFISAVIPHPSFALRSCLIDTRSTNPTRRLIPPYNIVKEKLLVDIQLCAWPHEFKSIFFIIE